MARRRQVCNSTRVGEGRRQEGWGEGSTIDEQAPNPKKGCNAFFMQPRQGITRQQWGNNCRLESDTPPLYATPGKSAQTRGRRIDG